MVDVLLTGFYWYEGDIDSHGNDFPSTQDIFKIYSKTKDNGYRYRLSNIITSK